MTGPLQLITIAMLLLLFSPVYTQNVLRVEKQGRVKTWKFYTGDEIYLKSIYSPDDWAKVTISDIHPEKNTVHFDRTVLKVEEILALKPVSRSEIGRWIQNKFLTFGAGLLIFSVADPLLGRSYRWWAPVVAGSSAALGFGLRVAIDRPFRFDKKHKLRLLNLSPPPLPSEDNR